MSSKYGQVPSTHSLPGYISCWNICTRIHNEAEFVSSTYCKRSWISLYIFHVYLSRTSHRKNQLSEMGADPFEESNDFIKLLDYCPPNYDEIIYNLRFATDLLSINQWLCTESGICRCREKALSDSYDQFCNELKENQRRNNNK